MIPIYPFYQSPSINFSLNELFEPDPVEREPELPLAQSSSSGSEEIRFICRYFDELQTVHLLLSDPNYRPRMALDPYSGRRFGGARNLTLPQMATARELGFGRLHRDLSRERGHLEQTLKHCNPDVREKLLNLGIKHEETIWDQQKIDLDKLSGPELRKQWKRALETESIGFLDRVLNNPRAFHLLSTQDLEEIFLWLSAREVPSLLETILESGRNSEISPQILLKGMKALNDLASSIEKEELSEAPLAPSSLQPSVQDQEEGIDAFQVLFDFYPREPGSGQALLFYFAENGISQGLSNLLIESSEFTFEGDQINWAFILTAMHSKGALSEFFRPHILRVITYESLNSVFEYLCTAENFLDLGSFRAAHVLERLSEPARTMLNLSFIKLCCDESKNSSLVEFFQSNICELLNKASLPCLILAKGEKLEQIYELFSRSRILDSLSDPELKTFLIGALRIRKTQLVCAILNKREHGDRINQADFVEILSDCTHSEDLIALIDRHPSYNGEDLAHFLNTAIERDDVRMISKLLEKERPENPIPPEIKEAALEAMQGQEPSAKRLKTELV